MEIKALDRYSSLIKMARTSLRIAAIGAISFFIISCDSQEQTEAKYVQRGENYFKEGQYAKAQLEFKNAIQLNPKNVEALYKIGVIAEKLKNLRGAFQIYSKVAIEAPQHIGAMNRLGRFFLAAGDLDRSEGYAKNILNLDSNNAEGLTLRGAIYFRKKDYTNAEADASNALRLAPDDSAATALLASTYRTQSKIDQALQLLDAGLRAHPDETTFHLLKADIYLKSGQQEKAEQAYLTLIKRQPKNINHLISMTKLYLNWKRKEDAEKLLRAAVAQTPEDENLKLILTTFLANQSSFEAAEKQLTAYLKAAPKNIPLLSGLANLYGREKLLEKAKLIFQEIRVLDPKGQQGIVAGNALARMAYQQGEFDVVRELVASILSVAPRSADALIMRVRLAMRDEAWVEAVVDLRTVLRDNPSSKPAYALLAAVHIKSQNWQLAREALENSVKLSQKNETVRMDLARVLLKLNEPNAAVTHLKQYSDKVPSSTNTLKLLAEILINLGRFKEAEVIVKRLAESEGSQLVTQAALGQIYVRSGRYDEALAAYRTAQEFKPESEKILDGIIRALVGKRNFDLALKEIDKYLVRKSNSAYAFFLQGGLYFLKKSPELAIASIRNAIRLRPAWKEPYIKLGQYFLNQNSLNNAIVVLEEGYQNTGSNEQVGFHLALTKQRNNDIAGAIHAYESILQRNPKHLASANNLASVIADFRFNDRVQLERALSLVERFHTSKQAAFLDTLGWVNFRLGNTTSAVALLERAVAAAPDAAEVKFHLSSAYFQDGQMKLARENLESILKNQSKSTTSEQAQELLSKIPKLTRENLESTLKNKNQSTISEQAQEPLSIFKKD